MHKKMKNKTAFMHIGLTAYFKSLLDAEKTRMGVSSSELVQMMLDERMTKNKENKNENANG